MSYSTEEELKKAAEELKQQFSQESGLYERLTGGSTRRIAVAGLEHLPKLSSSSRILDSACGPGIVTQLILDTAAEQGVSPPPQITAIDYAPGMIDQLNSNKKTRGWSTVEGKVQDAQKLDGLEDESFDAVIMNFGLFALPNAVEGVREIVRVLKPGGVAIITTWKQSSPVELLEEMVGAIRPDCVDNVIPISKDWYKKEKLTDTLTAGGFKPENIKVEEVRTNWENASIAEYVDALSGHFWDRIREGWSDEEKARWRPELEKRAKANADGSVSSPMISWMSISTK